METIQLNDLVRIKQPYKWMLPRDVTIDSVGKVVDIDTSHYPYEVHFGGNLPAAGAHTEVFSADEIIKLTDEEIMLWKLAN